MFWRKFRITLITFCLGLFVSLSVSSVPMWVVAQDTNAQVQEKLASTAPRFLQAQTPKPQNRQQGRLPGRREPGAGRGCGGKVPEPPLTALIPETNLGLTSEGYPTLFFYMPKSSAIAAEFTLLKEDQERVYEKTFAFPRTPGIFSLSLPNDYSVPPLELGKNYHWYFKIICPENPNNDGMPIYVDGWVQRVAPNRQNNRWYDTLTSLAQKRRSNPNDVAIAAEWENLLRSEGLNKVARKPIVGSLNH